MLARRNIDMGEVLFVLFVILSIVVAIFLLAVCLTLFRIEKNTKSALLISERKIIKTYGGRRADE